MQGSTVAAIATPQGVGGIGTVRISGPDAKRIADLCFRSVSGKTVTGSPGYTALYGHIINKSEIVDDAIALIFNAPKSYTGEDVVELSVHGGSAVVRKVLRTVLDNGASPAEGGEFTKRAYLNGKTDLLSAEAIINVISAQSDRALKLAENARGGELMRRVSVLRGELIRLAAEFGADADYPDEEIDGVDLGTAPQRLKNIERELQRLIDGYDGGRVLREGVVTVIAGRPNVGKSTLMNLLAGCRRSIVTPVAGTTRDVIEETVMLGDVMLRLCDTAGLRATDDEVERLGVELSLEKLAEAELILAVFDSSEPLNDDDLRLLERCRGRHAIAVVNKTDLEPAGGIEAIDDSGIPVVMISARDGSGLDRLTAAIEAVTGASELSVNDAVLQNERQRALVKGALDRVISAERAPNDAAGVLITEAADELFELTGGNASAEVADEIFKNFCVGK